MIKIPEGDSSQSITERDRRRRSAHQKCWSCSEILEKIKGPVFRSEINARIARSYGKNGDCERALKFNDQANNSAFSLELKERHTHHRTRIALRNVVEAYAFCHKLEEAQQVIHAYDPGSSAVKQYLSDAYSVIGAVLAITGKAVDAGEHFKKALDIARPIRNETHRSHAMSNIAKNQLYAGLIDDAFSTALEIQVTDERAVGMAARFSDFRNTLMKQIAYRYARSGNFEKAYAALDSQSVLGDYYPEPFVSVLMDHYKTNGREKSMKTLVHLERSLRREDSERGLIALSLTLGAFGETSQGESVLMELLEKNKSVYLSDKATSSEKNEALRMIDDVLFAHVVLANSSDKALQELRSEALRSEDTNRLHKAWGAVVGKATVTNESALLGELQPVSDGPRGEMVKYGAFTYFTKTRKYDLAESLISTMMHRNKAGCYAELAREIRGVKYWDHYHDESLNRRL